MVWVVLLVWCIILRQRVSVTLLLRNVGSSVWGGDRRVFEGLTFPGIRKCLVVERSLGVPCRLCDEGHRLLLLLSLLPRMTGRNMVALLLTMELLMVWVLLLRVPCIVVLNRLTLLLRLGPLVEVLEVRLMQAVPVSLTLLRMRCTSLGSLMHRSMRRCPEWVNRGMHLKTMSEPLRLH